MRRFNVDGRSRCSTVELYGNATHGYSSPAPESPDTDASTELELADYGSERTAAEILESIWHVGVQDTTMVADPTMRSLTWSESRYLGFSRQAFYRSVSFPDPPAGQSEISIAEADSARWRQDATRAAERLYREDLHMARVNAALFQYSDKQRRIVDVSPRCACQG